MKILIYIPAEDARLGKVDPKNYHNVRPQPGYENYVQVSITSDEYARLLDTTYSQSTEALIARHRTKLSSELPDLSETIKLEERIYEESQKITGEHFEKWYKGLSHEERFAYKTIYGN